MTMDPKIKVRWIEALRGGKFPQTTMRLRDAIGFCCLGVLCDLVRPDGWSPTATDFMHQGNFSSPGPEINEEAQLSKIDEWFLVGMNDEGKSFAEIADYIEQNL